DKVFQPDELSPGVVQLVKVYLAQKRKIAVGDKMAGRHGNKGVIAKVAPEEDMPVLPDGTPVEVVLNPLGVPSRMNVGQLLETQLGWAADVLGFEAHTPVFQGASEHEIGALLKIAGLVWSGENLAPSLDAPEVDVEQIRDLVEAIQGVTGESQTSAGRENGDRRGLGRSLDDYLAEEIDDGVRDFLRSLGDYAVEVGRDVADRNEEWEFEEEFPSCAAIADEDAITKGLDAAAVEILNRSGVKPEGKMRLRDGRSGVELDQDVTVGRMYLMKLEHLVDDKIHARSIGPYSLVTQQPLAGKAQFGGQRFGEMEVWALEAYGAANTLQEMLTVKSDDVSGRSRVYESIVKGDNLPEPGTPESFNVLVKELQALGLSVELGKEESEGIFPGS
ncbi:MAG: DNA-directed RNA polymerase subunit beta, partial [Gemmatimonadota bacterium]